MNLYAVKVGARWGSTADGIGWHTVESFHQAKFFDTKEEALAASKMLFDGTPVQIKSGPLWDVVKEPDAFFVHGVSTQSIDHVLNCLAGNEYDQSKVEVRINGVFHQVTLG